MALVGAFLLLYGTPGCEYSHNNRRWGNTVYIAVLRVFLGGGGLRLLLGCNKSHSAFLTLKKVACISRRHGHQDKKPSLVYSRVSQTQHYCYLGLGDALLWRLCGAVHRGVCSSAHGLSSLDVRSTKPFSLGCDRQKCPSIWQCPLGGTLAPS